MVPCSLAQVGAPRARPRCWQLARGAGQALLLGRLVLLAYAAAVGGAFAVFVAWYEQPALARRYGAQYDAYRRAVPGWVAPPAPCPPDTATLIPAPPAPASPARPAKSGLARLPDARI